MIKVLQRPEILIFAIAGLFVLISKFGLGLNYLSVWGIVKNYVDCFRDSRSKKILIAPIINYFIVPFLIGISAALVKTADSEVVNIITIIVSILTSMLFTLLAVIIDMKSKINDSPYYYSSEAKLYKASLLETYYAVMFEILVSIILLVLCLFNVFTSRFSFVQSCLMYGLAFLLVINLMMIVKRIFGVIDADMRN